MQREITQITPPTKIYLDCKTINLIELKDIVDNIIQSKMENGRVTLPAEQIRYNIYDLVIQHLRVNKLYFHKLNKTLLNQLFDELKSKYEFTSSLSYDSNLFDELCWKKANNLMYDSETYIRLKKKFCPYD